MRRTASPTPWAGGSFGEQRYLREVAGFVLSETRHCRGFVTTRHAHARASLNVVLAGGYAETLDGASRTSPVGTVIVKPAGQSHANAFQDSDARCLLLEPTEARCAELATVADTFSTTRVLSGRAALPIAHRIVEELRAPDACSRLAIEALTLELVVSVARRVRATAERGAPPWLRRVRQMLREVPPHELSLDALASAVDRHPSHVARTFRAQFGTSVSAYARRARLERAATAIECTERPLGVIALEAGFYDQSHFARAFRAWAGLTPSEYRRLARMD
jgi:AraC family transcriptional regulator